MSGKVEFLTLNNVPLFTHLGRLQRAQAYYELGMSMKKKDRMFVRNSVHTLYDFWEADCFDTFTSFYKGHAHNK